jgi:hypothetical protein
MPATPIARTTGACGALPAWIKKRWNHKRAAACVEHNRVIAVAGLREMAAEFLQQRYGACRNELCQEESRPGRV